jgi:hypothetical protein
MTGSSNKRDEEERGDATGASVERDGLLYRGIRGILRCDEAEVVEGIARYVMSQHAALRRGSALMERARGTPIPPLTALLGGLVRFLEVRSLVCTEGAVWVARLGNERRAIEPLIALLPEMNWSELKFRFRPDAAGISDLYALPRKLHSWRRIFKLVRRLHRRYEFFKVLRVVDLIGFYTRYLKIFRAGRFQLALMSSHSNPHGIAFNLAARRTGVPVVLITHGMPVRPVAPLAYDLAVVHCEAARQTYLEEGCRMPRVLIHGRRQAYAKMPAAPLPERMSVGIFLCKDVNETLLRALVERLLKHPRVSRILIRPHPKNLWLGLEAWVESLNEERLRLSRGGAVSNDLEETEVVLAGNSSVLVEALTAGRPSAYVPRLDYGPTDLHAFVARGLVYQFDEESGFEPDAILRFYKRADWPDVLRLFANIEEDETTVAARAAEAMRELVARPLEKQFDYQAMP